MTRTARSEDDVARIGRRGPAPWLVLVAAIALTACSAPPTSVGTTLYVSPLGDDQAGTGSAAQPYRTLTSAVAQAPAGATIVLADGTYSSATGEAFPIDVSGLEVRGASANGTVLAGNTSSVYGLRVTSGEATVRDLTVRGFGTGLTGANVWMNGGTLLLENAVLSNGARHGLELLGGTMTLRSTTVTENADDNVVARGNATLEMFDSLVSASLGADGINLFDDVTFRMRDTRVLDSDGSGIELRGGSADLGTATDPGGNTITGNAIGGGSAAQIEDDRPVGASIILAYGNDLGASVTGVKTGPDSFGFVWAIVGAGNQIDFGP